MEVGSYFGLPVDVGCSWKQLWQNDHAYKRRNTVNTDWAWGTREATGGEGGQAKQVWKLE